MKIFNKLSGWALGAMLFMAGGFASCDDPNKGEMFVTPSNDALDMTIIDVLERDASNYSEWLSLLKYTNYYNALKDASAKATVFCPTNEAMAKFYKDRNITSLEELDKEYAKAVVQQHIIADNTITELEIDNLAQAGDIISDKTLYLTYINLSYGYKNKEVDDVDFVDQVICPDSIFLNNHARLDRFTATTCSNGVFYVMGDVVKPLAETIYQKLAADQDYQIFANAIKESGYDSVANNCYDTLWVIGGGMVSTPARYTCLAVPDYIYKENGITDVASLKNYILANNVDGDTDADVALNKYMQYHFLAREYKTDELFDFMTDDETLIYETRLDGQAIIANMIDGVKTFNKDVKVIRSDIEARNGYINKIDGVMPVYHPEAVNVKWDFLNSEDIIAFVNNYGANKSYGNLFSTPLSGSEYKIDISETFRDGNYGKIESFKYKANETKTSAQSYRVVGFYKDKYKNQSQPTISQYGCYMNNYMCLNLGYAGYIEFTTPSIIAGKYKIVLHYLSDFSTQNSLYSNGSMTRFEMDTKATTIPLFKGLKGSRANAYLNEEITLWQNIEFARSGKHTFRITMMDINAKNNSNYHQYLDYVEFRPVE